MEKTVGRNDPCPCGSGKKYKNCCMHKPKVDKRSRAIYWGIAGACVVAGVVVGVMTDFRTGFAVGGGSLMLFAIVAGVRKPPPPNPNAGNPAGLDFGG